MNKRLIFAFEQMKKVTSLKQIRRLPKWVVLKGKSDIMPDVLFPEMGFGYEWNETTWTPIRHTGKVLICENVTIHSGANIVRGTADDDFTIIGSGTKIDYGVHVAHNVKIGRNCLIITGSIIGGSVTIGNNCYLGIGCMIKNKVKIGNNVKIGMGAVVLKDIPDNETWVGNPAKKLIK